jgi:hypothetical protein
MAYGTRAWLAITVTVLPDAAIAPKGVLTSLSPFHHRHPFPMCCVRFRAFVFL